MLRGHLPGPLPCAPAASESLVWGSQNLKNTLFLSPLTSLPRCQQDDILMPVRVEGLGENMAQNTVEVNQPHQWDVHPLAKLLPCRLLLAVPVSQTETCSLQTLMSLSCSASPNLVSECRVQDMSGRRNNLHKSQDAVGSRHQALKGRYYLYGGWSHKLKENQCMEKKNSPWACWWLGLPILSPIKLNGVGKVEGFHVASVSSFPPLFILILSLVFRPEGARPC